MPLVTDAFWTTLLTESGPWVGLVFYLLYRDIQKEEAVREALRRNTQILAEMTTLFRERMPRQGGDRQ